MIDLMGIAAELIAPCQLLLTLAQCFDLGLSILTGNVSPTMAPKNTWPAYTNKTCAQIQLTAHSTHSSVIGIRSGNLTRLIGLNSLEHLQFAKAHIH